MRFVTSHKCTIYRSYIGQEICDEEIEDYDYKPDQIFYGNGNRFFRVELVSHPMTLEYHLREMNWENLLEEAIEMGYLSHQTSTCGLHIHVNRNAFGENQSEQEKA
ncbi:MAG: hypothetical protein LIO74_07250, partial [Ruminococcus sp.]|nr:hypothetical protein [Ruminococcus sp.]